MRYYYCRTTVGGGGGGGVAPTCTFTAIGWCTVVFRHARWFRSCGCGGDSGAICSLYSVSVRPTAVSCRVLLMRFRILALFALFRISAFEHLGAPLSFCAQGNNHTISSHPIPLDTPSDPLPPSSISQSQFPIPMPIPSSLSSQSGALKRCRYTQPNNVRYRSRACLSARDGYDGFDCRGGYGMGGLEWEDGLSVLLLWS